MGFHLRVAVHRDDSPGKAGHTMFVRTLCQGSGRLILAPVGAIRNGLTPFVRCPTCEVSTVVVVSTTCCHRTVMGRVAPHR
jgi:hypothetical protein